MGIKSHPKYNEETDRIETEFYYDYDEDRGKPTIIGEFFGVFHVFLKIFTLAFFLTIGFIFYKLFQPIIDFLFPYAVVIVNWILIFFKYIGYFVLHILRFIFVTLKFGDFVSKHPIEGFIVIGIIFFVLKKFDRT